MSHHYDYIITGAGCAGSSLLMRMMREPFFSAKKILVIDQSQKTKNDRTWCFWEKQAGLFESLVYHRWEKLDFFSDTFSATLPISPYQYKMIRGSDLYTHVKKSSAAQGNIEWRYEKVGKIQTGHDKAVVTLETGSVTADYVFNSILPDEGKPQKGWRLLQHFKGWIIEAREPCFDPSRATFMDFRVTQKWGTTFAYVLPVSPTTALVEYTLFSEKVLPQEAYDTALHQYISLGLGIGAYTLCHEEFGIIPMTNHRFPLQAGRIVNMGIAGGQVKGSSGYAFQFIQKRTEAIIQSLLRGESRFSRRSFDDKKFHFYDSVLLNVLCKKKMQGADIFTRIFRKNHPECVLRFLDNESGLWDDFRIMRSMPAAIFLPSAIQEL